MATLRFLSPPTLLHNPTDFYSATVSSPKRCLSLSSNNRNRDVRLRSRSNSVNQNLDLPKSGQWRTGVSFFSSFLVKSTEIERLKQELLEAIAPLDRGAAATPEDQQRVDKIACKLEATNKVKEPLNSNLLNGKWELLYTTSKSILQTERPKFLRPNGKIFQAINADTLRAQNMETWPFFNQATANLVPLNARRVAVKFDTFKIAAVIPIKSRGSGRGQIEITFLDEELRITRGNQGNLFILRMVDPLYRVPP
ncbi:probable plastid-lipid-associated protein 4, chloroplastic isoform X1 [Sesamum indicum]|uniref:Probable plastid-lipid-associated protein 4, chloroplastic isoform X1 n=1 Tax=Sesamum indicum TaxID=4182 RepID=A0A6I9U5U1_SESIN|nr:probable plastid-lipid-associated protein 4, chloroplastic isoform X1 [Sesamum indicum]